MNDKLWMTISGFFAFTFFLITNFTNLFIEIKLIVGILQIMLNVFVFITWLRGYKNTQKLLKKLVVSLGIMIPPIMATITIVRVLLPAIF